MSSRKLKGLLAATMASALMLSGCGEEGASGDGTQTLRLAAYQAPTSGDAVAYQQWADRVEEMSEGSLTIDLHLQGSLLDATDVLSGVANGSAELGGLSHGYHAGELPLSWALNLPFMSDNQPALVATMQHLYETNDLYQQEWERNGVRPLFFSVHSAGLFGCQDPVEELADMQAVDIRAASLQIEDYEAVGANVVGMETPEVRDGLERGLIDCFGALTLDLATSFGIEEVTPYIYDFGRGTNGAGELIISNSVWDSLTEEEQNILLTASEEMIENYTEIQQDDLNLACDAVIDSGGTVEIMDDTLQAEWEQAIGNAGVERYLEIAGVQGEEFLEEYETTLERFEEEYSDYETPLIECADRS